jgi:hypothetical protein
MLCAHALARNHNLTEQNEAPQMSKLSAVTSNTTQAAHAHPPRRYGRYPWHAWFSERTFTLHRGKDYSCRTDIMMQQIRHKASGLNIPIHMDVTDDSRTITVTRKDWLPPAPKKPAKHRPTPKSGV